MSFTKNALYIGDIRKIAELDLNWEILENSSFMITGASGMIGSFLIDVLMYKNKTSNLNCRIYAVSRDREKAEKRFSEYLNNSNFIYISCDINQKIDFHVEKMDYIFHAASNTHPVAYATDPIGTVITNIIGLHHLLEFASEKYTKRFIFSSSVEVYGENTGGVYSFQEEDLGYINCNTLRAGYPESKRAGEALCQAYISQKKLDIVIPRLSRVYGPTMLLSDSKAISQFIKKGIAGEDIVLKSKGMQFFSYTYVADTVSAILYCLFKGKNGEAYNVSDRKSDILLRDLASLIAVYSGTKVIFEIPDAVEAAGYSKATKAVIDSKKIQSIGWSAIDTIETGIKKTMDILHGL